MQRAPFTGAMQTLQQTMWQSCDLATALAGGIVVRLGSGNRQRRTETDDEASDDRDHVLLAAVRLASHVELAGEPGARG
jgi:hypothetical protein